MGDILCGNAEREIVMATWSKICQRLERYADKTTELTWQESIRDIVLEDGLDWLPNQIEEQKSMQLGSTERLIPDIIVSRDDQCCFVVEVKRYNHVKTQKNVDQLISYMKQLETPVGIYVGNELEVYYKNIGDGEDPILVMSIQFNPNEDMGEDFVKLFTESKFSSSAVASYIEGQMAAKRFEKKVCLLVNDISSKTMIDEIEKFLRSYYVNKCYSMEEIDAAFSRLDISILEHREARVDNQNLKENEVLKGSRSRVFRPGIKRNNGVAQRYAHGLIKQILEKNRTLHYKQLYAIFGKKNYIEDINNVKDEGRWCMHDEDILTSIDGTRIVVSNQWGFFKTCKPRMDYLRSIAKEYGIDISLPEGISYEYL